MTPSYQETLEQLEAKGEEVRQLQDALLVALGHLTQMTLRSAKEISLREEMDALRAERDDVIAICRGTQMDDAAITSMRKYVEEKIRIEDERDALLKVYEATEVFVDTPRLATESALRDAVTAFRALAVQP